MPTQGVSMHKIKEILRLHHEVKLSQHQIARSLNLSSGAVNKYLALAKVAKIQWPISEPLSELELRQLLRPHGNYSANFCMYVFYRVICGINSGSSLLNRVLSAEVTEMPCLRQVEI